MARPIWKGAVTFGLVTVPVGLFPATERRNELSFNLLHAKDGSRIDYKRVCREEGVEVPWSEVAKGYQYEKGRYVILTDENFQEARVPATRAFEVRDFVRAADIDDLYFAEPYYLAPDGKGAAKAYALLRDALRESGRVGVGTIVLRQREHLAALETAGDALVLTTMRFAHEIRSPASLDLPGRGEGWGKREMKLARQLIDALASDWEPERYGDTYTEALKQVIELKVEGKEVSVPAPRKPPKIVDLAQALEASLKAGGRRKALARAPGRAARARRPRRAGAA